MGAKIDQTSIQEGIKNKIKNLNGFWMALGSIFGGFSIQVGRQVGTKLAPKSDKKGVRKLRQKMIDNGEPRGIGEN